jgi:hypothetical protein
MLYEPSFAAASFNYIGLDLFCKASSDFRLKFSYTFMRERTEKRKRSDELFSATNRTKKAGVG